MERLREQRTSGVNGSFIRAIAMVLLAMGVVGRGLIQSHLLGMGTVTGEELLQTMQNSSTAMILATVSLVFQAMEACAAPLFVFLLVEGFRHTSSLKNYVLRVLGLAVLCEIPYNLAMSGKLLDFGSRNPVFGLVVGLVVLYMYRFYQAKSFRNLLIKALVTVAALIWPLMLKVDSGICLVFLVCVMWAFRKIANFRHLAGATSAMACSLISPFYLAAPMSFLVLHFHNGEQGDSNRMVNYLAYPVILLAVAALRLVF